MTDVSQVPLPEEDEMLAYLSALDLFEMLSYTQLKNVLATGKLYRLEQGEYLFRSGDAPEWVHVVMGGSIEVVRATPDSPVPIAVAYITAGEAIGDMALFTGSKRSSSGRAAEYADIFTLTKEQFEALTRVVPDYGLKIATTFARRLDAFIKEMRGKTHRKELAGKLAHFDLPTVVQTLVTSKQTGKFTVSRQGRDDYAQLLLIDGSIERARWGPNLQGEEAVFELLRNDGKGEFNFRTLETLNPDDLTGIKVTMSAMNLLMEALRQIDEFPMVAKRLGDASRPLQATTKELQWEDDATRFIAEEMLRKLMNKKPLSDIADSMPCCTFTLYSVAAELYESGHIA